MSQVPSNTGLVTNPDGTQSAVVPPGQPGYQPQPFDFANNLANSWANGGIENFGSNLTSSLQSGALGDLFSAIGAGGPTSPTGQEFYGLDPLEKQNYYNGAPLDVAGGMSQTPGIMPTAQGFMDQNQQQYQQFMDQIMQGQQGLVDYGGEQWANLQQQIPQQFQDLAKQTGGQYEQLAGNVLGMQDQIGTRTQQDLANLGTQVNQQFGNLAGQTEQKFANQGAQTGGAYDALRGDIAGQRGDQYSTAMQYLEGAGDQERKDINEAFQGLGSRQQSDLAARGLGGTTVRQGLQSGTERKKQDALGSSNERFRNQYLDTHTGLSNAAIGDSRNLGAAGIQAQDAATMQGLGLGAQFGGQGIGALADLQGQGAILGGQQRGRGVDQYGNIGSQGIGAESALSRGGIDAAQGLGTAGILNNQGNMRDALSAQTALGATGFDVGRQDRQGYLDLLTDMSMGQFGTNRQADQLYQNAFAKNLQEQGGLGTLPTEYNTMMTNTILDILGGRVDQPGQSIFSNASGMLGNLNIRNEAEKANQQETDWLSPLIGGGLSAGGSFLGNPGLFKK